MPNRSVVATIILVCLAASCSCSERTHHGAGPADARAPERPLPAASATQAQAPSPLPVPAGCPRFGSPRALGTVAASALTEASGLVASRQNRGVLWSHNDAGGRGRLFAMSTTGADLGYYVLTKTELVDVEDIALGPGPSPGQWFVYLGDIGANNGARSEIAVFRTWEPPTRTTQGPGKRKLKHAMKYRFSYPEGASYDSECLMVDPKTSDLYLATKTLGAESLLFRAKAPLDPSRVNQLELVQALRLGQTGTSSSAVVTGGDISPDGSAILIRTYSEAFLWTRQPGESVDDAIKRSPCPVPVHLEPQGEAIAFAADGQGYLTVSEGSHPTLYLVDRVP